MSTTTPGRPPYVKLVQDGMNDTKTLGLLSAKVAFSIATDSIYDLLLHDDAVTNKAIRVARSAGQDEIRQLKFAALALADEVLTLREALLTELNNKQPHIVVPATKTFDAFEVHPCCYVDATGTDLETCDAVDADVWVVYGHRANIGITAIGEFDTQQEAQEIYDLLTGLLPRTP